MVSRRPQTATTEGPFGLGETERKAIAEGLSHLLADTYTLCLNTQNYHWNVRGPMFRTLHAMFRTQYKEMAVGIDTIAERIRALGHLAPGCFTDYRQMSAIAEAKGERLAEEMIADLVKGHEALLRTARSLLPIVEKAADQTTADLLTHRMLVHEKTAWLLRPLIQ